MYCIDDYKKSWTSVAKHSMTLCEMHIMFEYIVLSGPRLVLTHCGLVTPYGISDLSQLWFG